MLDPLAANRLARATAGLAIAILTAMVAITAVSPSVTAVTTPL